MKKVVGNGAAKMPPEASKDHADIEHWIHRQMPDLQPILKHLDAHIRKTIPKLQYAVKWQKAYYGTAALGWLIEITSYDVSVNVAFLGGASFDDPPADGSGKSRYVKVRTLEEAKAPEIAGWLEQAGQIDGWR